MATDRRAKAMCDSCGFVYPMRVMKLSSYDTVGNVIQYSDQIRQANHQCSHTSGSSESVSLCPTAASGTVCPEASPLPQRSSLALLRACFPGIP